jgi:hypothetical protein
MRSSTLVGHMGEISDIVGAILYLESASFVTGEILHVDGDQSVRLTSSLSHIAPYCFCFSRAFFWSAWARRRLSDFPQKSECGNLASMRRSFGPFFWPVA